MFAGASAPGERVVVLGAGLAGLSAAWELDDAGYDVTVIEARSRPGGRVRTLREPFSGGLHAEAGGMYLLDSDANARRYAEVLGLTFVPPARSSLPQLFHLAGRRFAATPGEPVSWPDELSAAERVLGPAGIQQRFIIDHLPASVADPTAWRAPELAALDKFTLADFMRANGASVAAVELMRHWLWFGAAIDSASMQGVAMADYPWAITLSRPILIEGGNDRLPIGMAARLGERVRYDTQVLAIDERADVVAVRVRSGGLEESIEAARVVVTLPAPVLRAVPIFPSLPVEQRRAIDELETLAVTRTYLEVRRPFWRDEGVSGTAITDLDIGQIERHPISKPTGDGASILESHVRGAHADELAALAPEQAIEVTLDGMAAVHPRVREELIGATSKAWSSDPYARAGFSMPGPGQVAMLGAMRAQRGRLHFAGEHTSSMRATMEGALRSGVRAAREVIAAARSVTVALVLAALVAGTPLAGAQEAALDPVAALDALAWLEGSWERETRRGISREHWETGADGELSGKGTMARPDSDEEFLTEALRVVNMAGQLYYVARPIRSEFPTPFRLVSWADDEFVFANPNHDFPQRITYKRTGETTMVASIAGPGDDGAEQVIEFTFRRAE